MKNSPHIPSPAVFSPSICFLGVIMFCMHGFGVDSRESIKGFTGPLSHERWGPLIEGNGYLDSSSPMEVVIEGSNSGAFAKQSVKYRHVFLRSGVVSFDWEYSTDDSTPWYDPGGYYLGGIVHQLSEDYGSNFQSGSVSGIVINAGDVLTFYVDALDDCCGKATLIISELEFTQSWVPNEWKYFHGIDMSPASDDHDKDSDGWTNFEEYWLGTDPLIATDSSSRYNSDYCTFFGDITMGGCSSSDWVKSASLGYIYVEKFPIVYLAGHDSDFSKALGWFLCDSIEQESSLGGNWFWGGSGVGWIWTANATTIFHVNSDQELQHKESHFLSYDYTGTDERKTFLYATYEPTPDPENRIHLPFRGINLSKVGRLGLKVDGNGKDLDLHSSSVDFNNNFYKIESVLEDVKAAGFNHIRLFLHDHSWLLANRTSLWEPDPYYVNLHKLLSKLRELSIKVQLVAFTHPGNWLVDVDTYFVPHPADTAISFKIKTRISESAVQGGSGSGLSYTVAHQDQQWDNETSSDVWMLSKRKTYLNMILDLACRFPDVVHSVDIFNEPLHSNAGIGGFDDGETIEGYHEDAYQKIRELLQYFNNQKSSMELDLKVTLGPYNVDAVFSDLTQEDDPWVDYLDYISLHAFESTHHNFMAELDYLISFGETHEKPLVVSEVGASSRWSISSSGVDQIELGYDSAVSSAFQTENEYFLWAWSSIAHYDENGEDLTVFTGGLPRWTVANLQNWQWGYKQGVDFTVLPLSMYETDWFDLNHGDYPFFGTPQKGTSSFPNLYENTWLNRAYVTWPTGRIDQWEHPYRLDMALHYLFDVISGRELRAHHLSSVDNFEFRSGFLPARLFHMTLLFETMWYANAGLNCAVSIICGHVI